MRYISPLQLAPVVPLLSIEWNFKTSRMIVGVGLLVEFQLQQDFGTLNRLPVISRRKVRMTSSHHAPYALGDTRATMAGTKGQRSREGEITPKPVLSSDCRLQLACMKLESLVIAGQPYGGEFIPGPCTHRPSHYGS
ncbi:hypothetical protein KSP40_PGU000223 [Platanthera guangdongensis]|uniref:Uncharacterized protein n=1 Tax=Platanthera guangdongensis TaxID=2320717 RepID=A0ABR2MHG5_9ASPA